MFILKLTSKLGKVKPHYVLNIGLQIIKNEKLNSLGVYDNIFIMKEKFDNKYLHLNKIIILYVILCFDFKYFWCFGCGCSFGYW